MVMGPVTSSNNWQNANQQYLSAALAIVRQALERQASATRGEEGEAGGAGEAGGEEERGEGTALQRLCKTFGLSAFEEKILLLCVGMELDVTFPLLCGGAQGDDQRCFPTFSLALMLFPNQDWNAFTPDRPLRRWHLIEVGAGQTLTLSPLRVDEWVLHFLMGVNTHDTYSLSLMKPVSMVNALVSSHQRLATELAGIWSQKRTAVLPIVQLCGNDPTSKQAIAAAACHLAGSDLSVITARSLPTATPELHSLMLLWERRAALMNSVLLVDCDTDGMENGREAAIVQLIEALDSPLILSSRDRRAAQQRPLITLDVAKPTAAEQRSLWLEALGDQAANANGLVETLVEQFNFSPPAIAAACAQVAGSQGAEQPDHSTLKTFFWQTCRMQARPKLDDLAQRLEPAATWDDLVLPHKEKQILRSVAMQVRQRVKVYKQWGFGTKGDRGLGISALFAGASGTGKTMSAEVLAQELELDLYRIDLSAIVSKYIGETEKNLRRVFDAAEVGATILLFDEADALFGKRSEVKDSHDRYANMEVSYLLQRMEAYQGLAILTTNLKDAIDQAFLRRLRFIVKFPFPEVEQRAEIWQRIFPKETPLGKLDVGKLAKLNVSGGNIRNIALNAAFLAAEMGEAVAMSHLLEAARSEYLKLERTLTDAEVKGWL